MMKRNNLAEMKDQVKQLRLLMQTQKIIIFLKNSKYVIFILTTFTICRIPWMLAIFYDFLIHQIGSLEFTKKINCANFRSGNNPESTIIAVEELLGRVFSFINQLDLDLKSVSKSFSSSISQLQSQVFEHMDFRLPEQLIQISLL